MVVLLAQNVQFIMLQSICVDHHLDDKQRAADWWTQACLCRARSTLSECDVVSGFTAGLESMFSCHLQLCVWMCVRASCVCKTHWIERELQQLLLQQMCAYSNCGWQLLRRCGEPVIRTELCHAM
jgi:hypothetical protein